MLFATDFLGTSLFAIVGTQCAGDAGMNIVGCTLVGCAAAMGGGTLNNLMIGRTPVFWMRDPRFLIAAVVSSVATFYLWPKYEEWAVNQTKQRLKGEERTVARLLEGL
eukprot:1596610-Prymnesium_polylepis.1